MDSNGIRAFRPGNRVAILAAGWLALILIEGFVFAPPCRAQIASYVEASGRVVYVNGDSPAQRSRSTIGTPGHSGATELRVPVHPPEPLDRLVREAAARHNLDPALVKAVISAESGWNPAAVSRKGAVGLMQLLPTTAERFGAGNPYDPAQNVEAGTTYLRALLDRYNGDLDRSLAAYNAGEHAVDASGGIPAYRETRQYVRKITNAYFQPGSGRGSSLWSPVKNPVRRDTMPDGRVVYTNE